VFVAAVIEHMLPGPSDHVFQDRGGTDDAKIIYVEHHPGNEIWRRDPDHA
jgi:hypothetical protein